MDEKRSNIENSINIYKQLLLQTDYQCLKHMDGALTNEEYEQIKVNRQIWRDEINRLEEELSNWEEI